jgi:hypothetical protein
MFKYNILKLSSAAYSATRTTWVARDTIIYVIISAWFRVNLSTTERSTRWATFCRRWRRGRRRRRRGRRRRRRRCNRSYTARGG